MKLTPGLVIIVILFSLFAFGGELGAQGWQWGRGNTGGGMDAWSVATDHSGNVFVAGANFSGDLKSTSGTGYGINAVFGSVSVPFSAATDTGIQCIIAKYDGNGNCLWAKGTQNGDSWPINIATDNDGNSFLLGTLISPHIQIGTITLTNSIFPDCQYFLAKFDPSGNVVWAKNGGNIQYGGAGVGNALYQTYVLSTGGIATDASGNIFITGNFHLPAIQIGSFNLTNSDPTDSTEDIFVAKYDPEGNVVWAVSSGGNRSDDAYGLTVTPSGDIYIAGVFRSSSIQFGSSTISDASGGHGNAFIAKFNSAGVPEWASESWGQGGEFAIGIASDISGNIYLTGGLSDNSISFCGTTIANPYPGNLVAYLIKFDNQDKVGWFKTIGSPFVGETWGYCISMSECGVIWVSGSFTNLVNIDGHVLDIPYGFYDPVFIAGFSASGVYAGSAALQSGADDQNGIACDAQGNVYMCADYDGLSSFVVGLDTLADITITNQDEWLFLAKYAFVNDAAPDTFTAQTDTAICPVGGMMLYAPPGFSGYLWGNSNTSNNIQIDKPGYYWVLCKGACNLIDSITVTTDNKASCPCKIYIPNTFTPNGDGLNDYFHPLAEPLCELNDYDFVIFNRWGQEVFKTTDPSARWDGKYLGIPAEMGTYMYYLKFKSGINKLVQTLKGDVTLVR